MAAHLLTPILTADDFIRFDNHDERDNYELIEGEICERAMNGFSHDRVNTNLNRLFDRADIDRYGFEVWPEHSFRMGEVSVMIPDVAIIASERLRNRTGNSPTVGAPDIAFEVTVSDGPTVLQRKISMYLRHGAHAVCCVYPDLRKIVVYTANHQWRELTEAETIEFPGLIPEISIPVSSVFAGLD